jgi:uncharacterized protein
MSTGAVRIVLDTNVVVSMIGRSAPNRWIFDKILAGEFVLCISNEIMLEYEEVLATKTTVAVASNFTDFIISSRPTHDKSRFPEKICALRGPDVREKPPETAYF